MLGIASVGDRECVCKGFSQNARVEVFVEVKLQKGTLFLQQGGVSVNKEVLKVVWSCFRSVREYEMCLQSLFRLLLAGSEYGLSFAMFLLIKAKIVKLGHRLIQAPQACCIFSS